MSHHHSISAPGLSKPSRWYLIFANILRAVIGTAILTLAAKTQVPLWPVPITMQSFAVVMIGALYGPRLGAATLLLYLGEGIIGLPVFAGSSVQSLGFGYLTCPTGGYLVGFVFAAYLSGYLSAKGWGTTVISAAAVFFSGLLVIEILGDMWLAYVIGINNAVLAILPYQIASIFKIGLGMCTLPLLKGRLSICKDSHPFN